MLIFLAAARPPHKDVIALAQAARNRQRIAGDPTRLVRRQEHHGRRYIVWLSGPPERRPRDKLLLEIVADDAHCMCALGFGLALGDWPQQARIMRQQTQDSGFGHRIAAGRIPDEHADDFMAARNVHPTEANSVLEEGGE